MKSALPGVVVILVPAALIWIVCSPVSTGVPTDNEPTLLILSLEEVGRKTAEFSGAPIEAIIELDEDTVFSMLHWHTGQGDPVFSDSLLTRKAKRFSIELTWKKYPLVKDSVDGGYYDTVYVTMGGGIKKSNRVVVKVSNLPVVADSAAFNKTPFAGSGTVWRYQFPDSAVAADRYPLDFYAHDLDGKTFSVQILTRKGSVSRPGAATAGMEYIAPSVSGDFVDTVTFIAYDQHGSQVVRRLVIMRMSPNIPPVIDSVLVRTTILKGAAYSVGFISLDSLKMRLFSHDTLGSVKKVIWVSKNYTVVADSADQTKATWICTSGECRDSTVDTTYLIDQVTVQAVDDRNDTTRKTISIYKGTVNKPPELKSLLFNGESLKFTDSVVSVAVVGATNGTFEAVATDPEKHAVIYTWKIATAARIQTVNDSTVTYLAPAQRDTDTLILSLSDGQSTVNKYVRILINDIGPIVDSLSIADTMVRDPDTAIFYGVKAGDTLLIIVYCRDRDAQDTIKYSWNAGYAERFASRKSNRAKYILPTKNLNDTIVCTVQDGSVQTVRKIILSPANGSPVIDSILSDGEPLKKLSASEYGDRAHVADTIVYKVYALDPEGSTLTYSWSVSESKRLITLSETSVKYICDTMWYKDTIIVTAKDSLNAQVLRRVILQVDTAAVQ